MINSINCDEFTYIACAANDDTTTFHDVATGRKLFTNLPPSICVYTIQELQNTVPDLTRAHVSVAEEGTTIRVFYNLGRWYTSTKRKLQAFRSNWADKQTSFGSSFAQALRNEIDAADDPRDDQTFLLNFYQSFLDKDCVYFFVLRSTPGERIVCVSPANTKALHICTQKDGINDFNHRISIGAGTFTHTQQVDNSFEAISQCMSELNHREHQGIIVEIDGDFFKLLLPTYARLAAIRGVTASLKICYLRLRDPLSADDRTVFLDLYPEFLPQVEQLETDIYIACVRLHQLYVEHYIVKSSNFTVKTKSDIAALKIIHAEYLATRIPTTPQRINDILTFQPFILNRVLKEMKRHNKNRIQ